MASDQEHDPNGAPLRGSLRTVVQAMPTPATCVSSGTGSSFDATPRQSDAAADEAQQRSLGAPSIIGNYRLLKRLGRGTFGEVWLAEESLTGKKAAVKFMHGPIHHTAQDLLQEVHSLALLHGDPGIVQIYDVVPRGDRPYFLMKYAEGGSLADLLRKHKEEHGAGIPVPRALEIFQRVCAAMDYVHVKGIRHCDLKPSNILLDSVGKPLVADFGQAHLASDASPALGSFLYMAPEQAAEQDQNPDSRWDVHAMGAILYELITGEPPRYDAQVIADIGRTSHLGRQLQLYREFVRSAPQPTRHRRILGWRDRPLAAIVDRCLEVDPAKRLKDAGAVLAALDRRERQLKQRTGLFFGVAATALLYVTTASLVSWSMRNNYEVSKRNLVQQVRENHLVSATMAANIIGEKLLSTRDSATRWAKDEQIVDALHARSREAMQRRAMRLYNTERVNLVINREATIAGITVVDGEGDLLAKYFGEDPGEEPFRRRWSWRRWFNGRQDYANRDLVYPPLAETKTLPPYHSVLSNEKDRYVITTSAPILDDETPPRSDAVGVLAVTINFHSLMKWLEPVKIEGGGVMIVDGPHSVWWPSPAPEPLDIKLPDYDSLVTSPGTSVVLHRSGDGRRCLVSWAPVADRVNTRSRDLVVLVIQGEREALSSLDSLVANARDHAFWLGVLIALVLAGGWLTVILRRAHMEGTVYV